MTNMDVYVRCSSEKSLTQAIRCLRGFEGDVMFVEGPLTTEINELEDA